MGDCPKCGQGKNLFDVSDLFGAKAERNFCSNCGARLRHIPHETLPPDWGLFSVQVGGYVGHGDQFTGVATFTTIDKTWRFAVKTSMENMMPKLKAQYDETRTRIIERNVEIDRINSQ